MNTATPKFRSVMYAAAPAALILLSACVTPGRDPGMRGDAPREISGAPRAATVAPAAAPRAATPAAAATAAPAAKPAMAAAPSGGRCPGYTPTVGADMNASMMYLPTGDPSTSALLIWQLMPKQVRANQTFTHEVHVSNLGTAPLSNVLVSDTSTKNLSIVSSEPRTSMTGQGGAPVWDLGDLGPCETKVIKITSKSGTVGEAGNCLVADYNNHHCAVTTVVDPRLEIVKSAPAEVLLCDNIPLSFAVKNAGSGDLANVVVKDQLPAGLTVNGQSSIELPVGALAQGETKTVTANAKADKVGRYDNTATAAATGDITASSNKTSTLVKQPKLVVTCEPEPTEYVNRTETIKYTVRNTGDVACSNTQLVATLPNSLTFESATNGGASSGGNVTWNLGTIAPGGSTSVSVDARAGLITNLNFTATASCACAEPATANCTAVIKGIPAVLLEVVDLVDPVEIGTQTTYVITVTNQGSSNDTNITMSVMLPPELTFVSASGATQATSTGQTTVFSPYATLAPGAKIEWRVVGKAAKAANIRSKFVMTTQETKAQGPIEETESTTLYD